MELMDVIQNWRAAELQARILGFWAEHPTSRYLH
jgi:hypothetical protein